MPEWAGTRSVALRLNLVSRSARRRRRATERSEGVSRPARDLRHSRVARKARLNARFFIAALYSEGLDIVGLTVGYWHAADGGLGGLCRERLGSCLSISRGQLACPLRDRDQSRNGGQQNSRTSTLLLASASLPGASISSSVIRAGGLRRVAQAPPAPPAPQRSRASPASARSLRARARGRRGPRAGRAVGLVELGQRKRGAQFEAARALLLCDGDGGQERFLRRRGVGRVALQQDFASRPDAVPPRTGASRRSRTSPARSSRVVTARSGSPAWASASASATFMSPSRNRTFCSRKKFCAAAHIFEPAEQVVLGPRPSFEKHRDNAGTG